MLNNKGKFMEAKRLLLNETVKQCHQILFWNISLSSYPQPTDTRASCQQSVMT